MQTPHWLKKRITLSDELLRTKKLLSELRINTVCESSLCPNLNECFSRETATFMILGKYCTRACGFCCVEKSAPSDVDIDEPGRILEAARRLGLKYIVVTSVTRDDLADGGAGQFAKVIGMIKRSSAKTKVEVLVPDFNGDRLAIEKVLRAEPDVFGHNIETVRRLYPATRREADYGRSLGVLRSAKRLFPGQITKTAIMVGLGETEYEVAGAMKDIRETGCDILAIGQYMRPAAANIAVDRFAAPEEFARYRRIGEKLGFEYVVAGPFVRSSYMAEEVFNRTKGYIHDRSYAAAVS